MSWKEFKICNLLIEDHIASLISSFPFNSIVTKLAPVLGSLNEKEFEL